MMTAVLDRGGEVSPYTRTRLQRALDQMPNDTLLNDLSKEVGRSEMRAARTVLGVASALAEGRGSRVDPALREYTQRLHDAVGEACAGQGQGVVGAAGSIGADRGGQAPQGSGALGLTFQQRMMRLSGIFTLYLIFVASVVILRKAYRTRKAAKQAALVNAPPTKSKARP